MRSLLFLLLLSSLLNLGVGCSSTSSIKHAEIIENAKTIHLPPSLTPYQKKYTPDIVKMLKSHGFKMIDTEENADLSLYFKIENGVLFRIKIQLREGSTTLVEANSKGLALPGAIPNMFKTTLNKLHQKLTYLETSPEF